MPDCALGLFINGDEELASFGVKNYAQLFRFVVLGSYIGGDTIEGIDGYDFRVIGQGKCFCEGNGYAQACEAAWASGDIDLFYLVWLFAEFA